MAPPQIAIIESCTKRTPPEFSLSQWDYSSAHSEVAVEFHPRALSTMLEELAEVGELEQLSKSIETLQGRATLGTRRIMSSVEEIQPQDQSTYLAPKERVNDVGSNVAT